jgi:hypothetical protein
MLRASVASPEVAGAFQFLRMAIKRYSLSE